jgi:hypothetical protein
MSPLAAENSASVEIIAANDHTEDLTSATGREYMRRDALEGRSVRVGGLGVLPRWSDRHVEPVSLAVTAGSGGEEQEFLVGKSDTFAIVLRSGCAVEPGMLGSEIDGRRGAYNRRDGRGRCYSVDPLLSQTLQRDCDAFWRAKVVPAARRRDDDA